MRIWTDPENWPGNVHQLWLRFLMPWSSTLRWQLRQQAQDIATLKHHLEGVREVSGDAYARSREKDKISKPVITKVNKLEHDLQALINEVRDLRAKTEETT